MKAVFFFLTARRLAAGFFHGRIRQDLIQLSPIQGREVLSESFARFCFECRQRIYKLPLMLFGVHAQKQINESVHLCLLRARNDPLREHDQPPVLELIQEDGLPIEDRERILDIEGRSILQMLVKWVRR